MTTPYYSRKRKAGSIENSINKINETIETNHIKLPNRCEFGSSCYRKNPIHVASFRHPIKNDPYFVQLRDRIVLFKSDIIELLDLLNNHWKDDHFFINLNLKHLFEGAKLSENV